MKFLPFLLLFLVGCGALPTHQLASSDAKIAGIEAKLATVRNQEIAEASAYIDIARNDLAKDAPVSQVAPLLADAESLLPSDQSDIGKSLKEINRQSTNTQYLRLKSEDALKAAQAKKESLEQHIAVEADKYQKTAGQWWNPFVGIKQTFFASLFWIALALGLLLLLPLIALAFPAVEPILLPVLTTIGKGIGWLVKAVPQLAEGIFTIAENEFNFVKK